MTADAYLEAVSDGVKPAIAAAEVMDRLAERLNSVGSTAGRMKETRGAAEAVDELAADAADPLAVIESAENAAGSVAEKGRTPKDTILEALSNATEDVRKQAAEDGLELSYGYGLDRYLEDDLEVVKRIESTDQHTETTLRWEFSDGVAVETDEGSHLEHYNFYKKLESGTRKKLQPDLASASIGDPSENPDEYARLSLGPRSRPWSVDEWIKCITDLVDERQTLVESVGSRTMTWERLSNEINMSRAVSRLSLAVDRRMIFAKAAEGGDLDELWVPSKLVSDICEEHGVSPKALQQELSARAIDSDALSGDRISETENVDGRLVRFWRLDATHDEVPKPKEIVDELETGADRLASMEWGDLDE
jgi:hypothetical protein